MRIDSGWGFADRIRLFSLRINFDQPKIRIVRFKGFWITGAEHGGSQKKKMRHRIGRELDTDELGSADLTFLFPKCIHRLRGGPGA